MRGSNSTLLEEALLSTVFYPAFTFVAGRMFIEDLYTFIQVHVATEAANRDATQFRWGFFSVLIGVGADAGVWSLRVPSG